MKAKQKRPALKVTVSYREAPDATKRLHRVFEILLANSLRGNEKLAEEDLTKETPPTGGNNVGPTSDGAEKDETHEP